MQPVESVVNNAVQWLRLGIETVGVFIIALGVVVAIFGFGRALLAKQADGFNPVRLQLARYLALEFQWAPIFCPRRSRPRDEAVVARAGTT